MSMTQAPEWVPDATGFTMTIDGVVYRVGRFPVGSDKRGRYGAWAGLRLLGDAPKLVGAQALCEREAARARLRSKK
jgi:hypothetical protein